MATIKKQPAQFKEVYQIEKHDQIIGGEGGTANQQAVDLIARDEYLKEQVENGQWAMIAVQANNLALSTQQAHLQIKSIINA